MSPTSGRISLKALLVSFSIAARSCQIGPLVSNVGRYAKTPQIVEGPGLAHHSNTSWRCLNFYRKNYEFLEMGAVGRGASRSPIGSKELRKCRFCGQAEPATTFARKAHVISAFLGNSNWITYEECDQCNEIFSRFETSFANYSNFERTILGIRGRKSVPLYKEKARINIEYDKSRINMTVFPSAAKSQSFDGRNTLTINHTPAPYSDLFIYKCLLKYFISMLPSGELETVRGSINWLIKQGSLSIDCPESTNKLVVTTTFGNGFILRRPVVYLLKKRTQIDSPHYVFVLCFGRRMFQIFPPTSLDSGEKKSGCSLVWFPPIRLPVTPHDYEDRCRVEWENFDSDQQQAGRVEVASFRVVSRSKLD